jgi:hypothetical protein
MISKEKKDYKAGDKIFKISFNSDYSIEEMEVEKIGNKYMYLSNDHRYEFGKLYTECKWSNKEWDSAHYLESLFASREEADEEINRHGLIKKMAFNNTSIYSFLSKLSTGLLNNIYEEITEKLT